jgi:hypothetical protein
MGRQRDRAARVSTEPEPAEPPKYAEQRARAATIRSKLMLEVASVLIGEAEWPHKQVRIGMRAQGDKAWGVTLFGSDGTDAVDDVLNGDVQFAIVNPATAIGPALRHRGVEDGALVSIATIPSYDQLGLAVTRTAGVTSLSELAAAKPALTVSLRGGRPNHMVHQVLADTLAAAGMSLADISAWGGAVRYQDGLPHGATRAAAMRSGTIDALFDEGIYNWAESAVESGMRLLAVPDDVLERLAAMGYRRGTIRRDRYAGLDADVPTVDFSGFLVYTRADTPPAAVTGFCEAMVAARDRIPWQGGASLPLERMCVDAGRCTATATTASGRCGSLARPRLPAVTCHRQDAGPARAPSRRGRARAVPRPWPRFVVSRQGAARIWYVTGTWSGACGRSRGDAPAPCRRPSR